jgi:hypothetical protein
MTRLPSFLIASVLCPTLLLTGTAGRRASLSAPLAPSAPPPAAEQAAAAALLEQAVARLASPGSPWQDVTVWQHVDCDELNYQVRGRYLTGPDRRRRLQLQVQVGSTRGQVLTICDGKRVWTRVQVGMGEPSMAQQDLPGGPAQAEAVLLQYGLAGAEALLPAIRARLQAPHWDQVLWGGREAYRISGDWPAACPVPTALPDDAQVAAVPRRCRVYLDARTLWPLRVEWWGQGPDGAALVAVTEFRDPVLGRPLSPERCAREFAIGPTPAAAPQPH